MSISPVRSGIELFSGSSHPDLAARIADCIGVPLGPLAVTRFPDGEIHVRIDVSVRGKDVYLIQPTGPPVNENFAELLIILDALRRASAGRITAVIPYYGYARQDKKTAGREPITARMVADMITTGGADRILTLDLHSPQIQGFFDIPVDHLTAVGIISAHLSEWDLTDSVIVTPDAGRMNMAAQYAGLLGLSVVIIHKRRASPEQTQVTSVVGEVDGKRPIIIDDMISTGGTIDRSVKALTEYGAKPDIRVAITHPVLVGKSLEYFANPAITRIVVTDTLPIHPDKRLEKMSVTSVAPLIAEAIELIHTNSSVSGLFPA